MQNTCTNKHFAGDPLWYFFLSFVPLFYEFSAFIQKVPTMLTQVKIYRKVSSLEDVSSIYVNVDL